MHLRGFWRKALVVALLLVAIAPIAFAWTVSSRVIATPARKVTTETPQNLGLAFEAVPIRTGDGLTLDGWLVPAQAQARAGLVFAHGRGGNRTNVLETLALWHAAGYCVVAYDTRGVGKSEMKHPGDGFAGGWQDIVAAAELVRKRCRVNRVGVVGISQGATNAITAAARSPHIDAVVATGAGANLYGVLRTLPTLARMPDALLRLITRFSLLRMHRPWSSVLDLASGPVSTVHQIAPRALFLIHGDQDDTVPVEHARELHRRAGQPKMLWEIPGGGHRGLRERVGQAYDTRVMTFLARHLLSDAAGR